MKNITLTLSMLMLALASNAQNDFKDTIYVSTRKNVWVNFPETVYNVDPGTKNYAAAIKNKAIVLKATEVGADPTSIIVQYGDSKFYNGTLAINEIKAEVLIDWSKEKELPGILENDRAIKEEETVQIEQLIVHKRIGKLEGISKARIKGVAIVNGKMALSAYDIRQDANYIYVKLLVVNKSKDPYNIEVTDFLYYDPQDNNAFGDGTQERVTSLADSGLKTIDGKSENKIIYTIPRIVLGPKGYLLVTMNESNGTRRLEMKIPSAEINQSPSF